MLNFLIVGAGGFVGAAARYGISLLPLNERSVFPVNTLIINVVGAFAIGLISAAAKHTGLDGCAVLFLKAGICGSSDLYRAERSAVNRGGVPRAGNCVTARSQDHVIK